MYQEEFGQSTRIGFMSRPLRSNLVKEKGSRERSLKRVKFEDSDDDGDVEEQRNAIQFAHTVESYRLKRDKLMNALAEFKLRQQSPPSAKRTQKHPPPELHFDTQSSIQADPQALKTKSTPKTVKGLGLYLNVIDPHLKENAADSNISPTSMTKRITDEKGSEIVADIADRPTGKSKSKHSFAFLEEKEEQMPKVRESLENSQTIKDRMIKNIQLDRYIKDLEENSPSHQAALNLSQNAEKLGELIEGVAGLHSMPILQEAASRIKLNRPSSTLVDIMEAPQISSPSKRIKGEIAARTQMLLDSRFLKEERDSERKKAIFENLLNKSAERANSQESNSQKLDELNTSRRQQSTEQEQQLIANQIKLNLLKNMTSRLTPLQTPNPSILQPLKDDNPASTTKSPRIFDFQEAFAGTAAFKEKLDQSVAGSLRASNVSDKLAATSDRLPGMENLLKGVLGAQLGTPGKEKSLFESNFFKNVVTSSNILEALPAVKSELFNLSNPEKAKGVNRLFNLIENLVYKNYMSNLKAVFTQLMINSTLQSEKWIVFSRVSNKLEELSREEVVRENSLRDAFSTIKKWSNELRDLYALASDYHDKNLKATYFVALASYALKKIGEKAKVEENLSRIKKRTLARSFKAIVSFAEHQQQWLEEVRKQFELLRAGYSYSLF